ncbi:hypothetical protein KIPB_003532 [Kipferlia bialata]|uniref:Uncharacterized protein n=1 Tax=Kipferlia bialata TaxID=797122 RepID=A0A9K3CTK7_9EUKA|nr:hypothetical protein KIPB_003532 [Kipferlia bialata]|eukprot:g3532.t1
MIVAHTVRAWNKKIRPTRSNPNAEGIKRRVKGETLNTLASYLWRVMYDAYLSPKDLVRLRNTCRKLVEEIESLTYGPDNARVLPDTPPVPHTQYSPVELPSVPAVRMGMATAQQLLPVLQLWAETGPVNFNKCCARSRTDVHLARYQASTGTQTNHSGRPSIKSMPALGKELRVCAKALIQRGLGICMDGKTLEKQLDYVVDGSYTGAPDEYAVANPTMYRVGDYRECLDSPLTCRPLWTAHYGTQPILGYPSKTDSHKLRSDLECESIFVSWLKCLGTAMTSERVEITLLAGDCLQLLLERSLSPHMHCYADTPVTKRVILSYSPHASKGAPAKRDRVFVYDYITASNMADYIGLLNLLVVVPGFLRTPGVSVMHAVALHRISSETTTQSLDGYLRAATGVRVRDLPHVFGVRALREEEEEQRGSEMLAFSILRSASIGTDQRSEGLTGGSSMYGHTNLSFTPTPVPLPPPCIDIGIGIHTHTHIYIYIYNIVSPQGEAASGHVHRCLMGVLHKTLPASPNGNVGHSLPCLSTFCALVAIGCRRGLYQAQAPDAMEAPHYLGVPVGLDCDTLSVCGEDRVGTGRVLRGETKVHIPDGQSVVSLYRVHLASPMPRFMAAVCGKAPEGSKHPLFHVGTHDGMYLAPSLFATMAEYGIDTRVTGGEDICLCVRVLDTEGEERDAEGEGGWDWAEEERDEDGTALRSGDILTHVTMVPRRVLCPDVDMSSNKYAPSMESLMKGEGMSMGLFQLMSTTGLAPGMKSIQDGFNYGTPAISGSLGADKGGCHLGGVATVDTTGRSTSWMVKSGSVQSYALYGVGPVPFDASLCTCLRKSVMSPYSRKLQVACAQSPVKGPSVHCRKGVRLEACSVCPYTPYVPPPHESVGVGVRELRWSRHEGSTRLTFEVVIPTSVSDSFVKDTNQLPTVVPIKDPKYTLPGTLDAYIKRGVPLFEKTIVGVDYCDVYSVKVMLGKKRVGAAAFPVPVNTTPVKIQISRSRRFVRVVLDTAAYTLPGPASEAMVSLSPTHLMPLIEPKADIGNNGMVPWGDITLRGRSDPNMIKTMTMGSGRLVQCLGMAVQQRRAAMRGLINVGDTLQMMFVQHVLEGERFFMLMDTDLLSTPGQPGTNVGMVYVHGLYRTAASCVLDVSLALNADVPPWDVNDLAGGLHRLAASQCDTKRGERCIKCNSLELQQLGRIFNYCSRHTADAAVHPDIHKNLPQTVHKYLVRLGILPTHAGVCLNEKAPQMTEAASKYVAYASDPVQWMREGAINY